MVNDKHHNEREMETNMRTLFPEPAMETEVCQYAKQSGQRRDGSTFSTEP